MFMKYDRRVLSKCLYITNYLTHEKFHSFVRYSKKEYLLDEWCVLCFQDETKNIKFYVKQFSQVLAPFVSFFLYQKQRQPLLRIDRIQDYCELNFFRLVMILKKEQVNVKRINKHKVKVCYQIKV